MWEKIVIGALILGLIFAAVSFVWNLLTFCACCCRGSIFRPLPLLSAFAGICIAISVALFWFKNQNFIEDIKNYEDVQNLYQHNTVSYSFWLAVGACLASFANLVVGSLVVCLADKYL
ncbi:tight junction protein, claudin-like domain-containing protein [Ditylenchus destructor]|nr:tight junction protein, claudin-like domain-containing protein [Ditylenchus destructor]